MQLFQFVYVQLSNKSSYDKHSFYLKELGYLIFYKYFLFEVLLRIYNQTENRTRNKGWQYLIFARKENVSSVRHRTERVGYDVDFRTIIRRSAS